METWGGFIDLRHRLFRALCGIAIAIEGDEVVIVSLTTGKDTKWYIALKRHKAMDFDEVKFWHRIDTGFGPEQSGSPEFETKVEHLLTTISEFSEALVAGGVTVHFSTQLSDIYFAAEQYEKVALRRHNLV